jgi:Na+/melibiose symporter-like transporter
MTRIDPPLIVWNCCWLVQVSFFLYYFTFVAELSDSEISTWIVAIPVVGLLIQSLCAVFWGRFFASKSRTPRDWTIAGRLLDAVCSIVIIGSSSSINGFLLWFVCNRALLSPRSFWGMSARGWVIDEDALVVVGRRRESLFTGVSSAMSKVATLLGSALIAGQALAGIDTTKDRSYVQPASGVLYIRCMYMVRLIQPATSPAARVLVDRPAPTQCALPGCD